MRRLAVLAILALVAGACSGRREALGVAPAFRLPDLAGGTFDSSELRGRVVVLDFWATWCAPCLAEMPDYDAFWKRNRGRGVEVVGVVVESGDPAEVADFVRSQRVGYRQLLGDAAVQEAFRVYEGLPTTFVIDAQGKLVARILGAVPGKFESLQKTVDLLLARR